LKFNARTLSVVGIIVFIVALAVLFLNYQNQNKQLKADQSNLDAANASLNQAIQNKTLAASNLSSLEDQITQLQNEIAVAQRSLVTRRSSLPTTLNTTDCTQLFTDKLNAFNIRLTGVSNGGIHDVTQNNLTFSTISFSVSIVGEANDVLNMLQSIATDPNFKNATLETITLQYNTQTVVDFKMTFYAFKGS
jgi:Tfp pilus assembly protein PilO